MKSIADKLQDTVKLEEKKIAKDKNFKEFEQLISQMNKLCYSPKTDFSFPLVDTIGKTANSTLNKHSVYHDQEGRVHYNSTFAIGGVSPMHLGRLWFADGQLEEVAENFAIRQARNGLA